MNTTIEGALGSRSPLHPAGPLKAGGSTELSGPGEPRAQKKATKDTLPAVGRAAALVDFDHVRSKGNLLRSL